jgi:benzoate 4-monooxygenase
MLLSLDTAPYVVVGLVLAYFLAPYFQRWHLRDIPSPSFAAFSNLWLLIQTRQGKRFLSVDAAHKKHGKLVRISPTQVSIADDAAVPLVYGHGNGFLKA